MKECKICQKEKKLDEFYERHSLCKNCLSNQRKRKCNCNYCKKEFFPQKKGAGRFCSLKCRFLDKIEKTETCWIWKAGKNKNKWGKRYGTFQMGEKLMLAHRVSYELFKGKIPKGKLVCHQCDNEVCVNPSHLWLGSYKDNMKDMVYKKRGNYVKGGKNPAAKLTEDEVEKIKELHIEGVMINDIAKTFGVTRHCIQHILNGKTWRHTYEL